jgi:hypothetical protein
MPDDNVTLLPVFGLATGEQGEPGYVLDFTFVLNGTIPEGWRCVQEDNQVHEYPNSFSAGARTFVGNGGYQEKALYWRNNCAEYGRQTAYPLTLEPGSYKLTFAMAAWKESPKYKVQILSANGSAVATSEVYTAAPNANGSTTANLSSAVKRELDFDITSKGKYIISFTDATTTGGYHEFLLLECKLTAVALAGINNVAVSEPRSGVAIYSASGLRRQSLEKGLNIVVGADGVTRKIFVK